MKSELTEDQIDKQVAKLHKKLFEQVLNKDGMIALNAAVRLLGDILENLKDHDACCYESSLDYIVDVVEEKRSEFYDEMDEENDEEPQDKSDLN